MISDNNLTAQPMEHFKEVTDFLKEHKLRVIFDNGFDCRLFTDEHLKYLKDVRILKHGLRFAFDNMSQDKHIQRTLKRIIDSGISKEKLYVFVLFNFTDTPAEAEYRMRTVVDMKTLVYPQQYVPLNTLSRKPVHVGKHWTLQLLYYFRSFYHLTSYYRKMNFLTWVKKNNWMSIVEDFNEHT